MAFEPLSGELDDGFQRTGFWKEMVRARNDLDRPFAFQTLQSPLVQFDNAEIGTTHDQKRRSRDMGQRITCKIRTAAARNHRANAIGEALAATSAAAAPVLAPNNPIGKRPTSGSPTTQRTAWVSR